MAQYNRAYTCPYCNSISFKKNGKYKNVQRYLCHKCNKSFKDTTDTPLHWLHKTHKLEKYSEALQKGLSVRAAARYAGISKNTSFQWRHKLLSSLTTEPLLSTITAKKLETSIFKIPYLAKGRRKAPELDQSDPQNIIITCNDQLKLVRIPSIAKPMTLKKILNIGSEVSCVEIIPHRLLNKPLRMFEQVKIVKNKSKNRNQFEVDILGWMERFRGVSTKYLQHYWNWYSNLKNIEILKNDQTHFYILITANRTRQAYLRLKSQ